RITALKSEAAALRDDQRRAGEAEKGARDMMPAKALSRHEGGAQHDQQRPQIGDEACLDRRGVSDRREIEEVIAEEAADPDEPHGSRHFLALTEVRRK